MKVIGLCGGSGSGKSTLSACMAELGAKVIDADQIARSLTKAGSPTLAPIRKTFGDGVFYPDGTLNRKALAALVFSDLEQLKQLNAITHPEITKQIQKQIRTCPGQIIVIDAAVLHQAGLGRLCDKTFFVTAPKETRIQRIMARDGITRQEAEARINAQPSDQEYEKLTDETVCNNGARSPRELAEYIIRSDAV